VRVAAEACWGGSVPVQAAVAMVIREAVQAVVLRCVVARADGGGGLWWPEPMMEAACMYVWASRLAIIRMAMVCHKIQ
jgi:hypothetical protein